VSRKNDTRADGRRKDTDRRGQASVGVSRDCRVVWWSYLVVRSFPAVEHEGGTPGDELRPEIDGIGVIEHRIQRDG
jgi:hypothetical protein